MHVLRHTIYIIVSSHFLLATKPRTKSDTDDLAHLKGFSFGEVDRTLDLLYCFSDCHGLHLVHQTADVLHSLDHVLHGLVLGVLQETDTGDEPSPLLQMQSKMFTCLYEEYKTK